MKSTLCSTAFALLLPFSTALAGGQNLSSATDSLSAISSPTASCAITPPSTGKTYVVKVNFLKAETAAAIANAFIDKCSTSQEERSKARSLFSFAVDYARKNNSLTASKSSATFSVIDPSGKVIKTEEAGLLTLGQHIEFTPTTSGSYTVEVNCTSGAGLYHMVFENK